MIIFSGFVAAFLLLFGAPGASGTGAVVIYNGVATEIGGTKADAKDLWISTAGLTRATGFELKPQGMCTNKMCIPLPNGKRSRFVSEESGASWFNLSEFARLTKQ